MSEVTSVQNTVSKQSVLIFFPERGKTHENIRRKDGSESVAWKVKKKKDNIIIKEPELVLFSNFFF